MVALRTSPGIKGEVDLHAARLGYAVELAFTTERSRKSTVADILRKVRHLAEHRAEGIIFRPFVTEEFSGANMEIVSTLRNAEIPVVLIDCVQGAPGENPLP